MRTKTKLIGLSLLVIALFATARTGGSAPPSADAETAADAPNQ